ncbi:alpha/beta fold hydrolase [Rossellomorea oryzaecorticis]|uniref:Alpha/beta fold hydrolase n=1 Tax=Rossellomorea oryzaecorticis TaxID=1396505 RepID=A0ABU9K6H8_9BACI
MEKGILEYMVLGEGKTPLVLEVGIGGSFYNWWPFVQELRKDFTIVMYHRAGYGKSKVSSNQRDIKNIAEELDSLLIHLAIKEKFVLVGHSFGGLCVQQYAKMFPEKLKAVVLIDSTSFQFKRLYDLDLPVMYSYISLEKMIESNLQSSLKTREELELDFQDTLQGAQQILPEEQFDRFVDFITSPDLFKTIAEEFQNWDKDSEIIKAAGEFPEIPLVVIARDEKVSALPFIEFGIPEEEAYLHEKIWRELQIELSQMNSQGKLVLAHDSDHEIHKDRPEVIVECLQKYK